MRKTKRRRTLSGKSHEYKRKRKSMTFFQAHIEMQEKRMARKYSFRKKLVSNKKD